MWLAIWPGVILIVVGACAGVSYSSYELSHDRRNKELPHMLFMQIESSLSKFRMEDL